MGMRILAISLLIVWLFQSLFSYLLFEVAQHECRKEFSVAKKNIAPSIITTLRIANTSTINWEDNGNEISYNNTLYDVVSIEKTATVTIIKCVRDTKENLLTEAYVKLKNKIEQHKKQTIKKIKMIDVSTINHAVHVTYCVTSLTITHGITTPQLYWSYAAEINPPPPKA